MKKKIFTLLFLSVFTGLSGFATHYIGSEIYYSKVAPGIYVVTFKSYVECNSIISTAENLNFSSPGCNSGSNITLNKMGSSQLGQLYGNNACTTSQFNYMITTYTGTLTLNPNQQVCNTWVLSVIQSNRVLAGNVSSQTAGSGSMYTEAVIKLNVPNNNNSPQFDAINPVIPLVPVGQPVLLSMSATDADGDSLSYELVSALDGYNTPIQYANVPNSSGTGFPSNASTPAMDPNGNCVVYNTQVAPSCSTQFKSSPFDPRPLPLQTAILPSGFCTSGGGGYPNVFSATYPLPAALQLDWVTNCPTNVVAGSYFILNPQNGSLEFHPSYYNQNPSMNNNNRYFVSVKVNEWRRNGAVVTLLGSVRRETMIVVGPGTGNFSPRLAPNAGGIQKSFVITPGATLNYSFMAADDNAADSVQMLSNAATVMPGATFTTTNSRLQSGTLNWTPTALQARNQPYYFNIVLKDNAATRGYTVETIKVEVRNSGVSAVKNELQADLGLAAFPNPYTHEVSFKLNLKQKTTGKIVVFNVLGSKVGEISLQNLPAGEKQLRMANAPKLPAGQYVARLVLENNQSQTVKFIKLY